MDVPGAAFGATSTLVAQMGILLGMLVSQQSSTALLVASAASAISGSFGDAFSIFISESTAQRDSSITTALSVLVSKLLLGATYVLLFSFLKKQPIPLVLTASILTLFLLILLSREITKETPEKLYSTVAMYSTLTVVVVVSTSLFGLWIRSFS
jgi:hypothetical protein